LIRDANCDRVTDFADNFIKCFDNSPPDFFGIVFNPTGFGKVLRELAVCRDYFLAINKYCAAPDASGASINSHDVGRLRHVYRFLRLFERCCDGPVVVRLVGAGRTLVGDDCCDVLPRDRREARGVRTGVERRRSVRVLR